MGKSTVVPSPDRDENATVVEPCRRRQRKWNSEWKWKGCSNLVDTWQHLDGWIKRTACIWQNADTAPSLDCRGSSSIKKAWKQWPNLTTVIYIFLNNLFNKQEYENYYWNIIIIRNLERLIHHFIIKKFINKNI